MSIFSLNIGLNLFPLLVSSLSLYRVFSSSRYSLSFKPLSSWDSSIISVFTWLHLAYLVFFNQTLNRRRFHTLGLSREYLYISVEIQQEFWFPHLNLESKVQLHKSWLAGAVMTGGLSYINKDDWESDSEDSRNCSDSAQDLHFM